MAAQDEVAQVQTKESFEAEVQREFRWNGPLGIVKGLLLYLNMGLHYQQTVISTFLFVLSGSKTFVGLASTLQLYAHNVPQLFGSALVEHLPVKKKSMLIFGWASAICWFVIAAGTFYLTKGASLTVFLIFNTLAAVFMGLYLLVWTDVMSKVIPVEKRGNYFGVRNFLSTLATTLGSAMAGYLLARFLFPTNYALTFFAGFVFFALALVTLALTREPAAWRTSKKESFKEKIRSMPGIFKKDPNFLNFCCIRAVGAGFCQMAMPFYIIFAMQRLPNLDVGMMVGILGTTLNVSRAVGNLFWGLIAQRRGYKVPMELSFTVFAIAALGANFGASLLFFIILFTVNGLAMAGLMMSTNNILMEFGQIHNRTTYIGIASAISGLVGGLAPLFGGVLSDLISYQALFVATAVISIGSTLAMRRYVVDPRYVEAYKQ